jgi:sugar phosphate isomerase/epimerase
MKFAFSSNAFLRYGLVEAIKIIAEIGYEGVEIMADAPHAFPRQLSEPDVREIRRVLDANGLEISNLNAFMHHADGDTYHPSWIEDDPALRAKRIDYTLRCIDLAEKLGVRHLSTEPGGPLLGMSEERGLALFKEGLAVVEKSAREKGVRVLIEPEPGLLIEKSTQILGFLDQLDPDVFGLNFDIGHFFCVGEDPSELVEPMRKVAHHFHLEDIAASREHYHLLPGKGAIDLPAVLNLLEETGYSGFVTVELYTYEERAEAAAREAFEYLRRWRESVRRPA